MSEYKKLTNNNLEDYDPEYDFCVDCRYFGEPNGCNRPNGTCDSYDRFMETYNRLAELEDKIENGTLRDFPCTVGDEVFWACDLDKQYSQVMRGVVIGLSISPKNTVWFSVKYDDGLSFDHTVESWGKSVFLTKAEAEARLKELDNSYKENR